MEENLTGDVQYWSISGAGGGKEGGQVPTEEPDTLRSRAIASVLSLFCEGPIQGFPTGGNRGQFIFLDDTPLVGADNEPNFGDVQIAFTTGTQSQSSLAGFNDIKVEQSLGVKVTKATGPASLTTSSADLDRINVRIGVASLFQVDEESGDVRGTQVKFKISILDSLGSPIVLAEEKIAGKTRGPYDREYNYELTGVGPWTVRVERITKDPENLRMNNDLYFKAITGIINETLRYPNSALLGFTVSAENFQSVPSISAELLGMLIQVPSNYNQALNEYVGVWDGSFKTEYNNNPVWVFYDLLTNPRYGCGDFVEKEDIDIYALLPIAKYCDEMVPNGKGGMEKRFTFNGYINNRGDAYEVLSSLAAAFRGMTYYAQGLIIATQDRPGEVVKQFSPTNVVVDVSDSGEVTAPAFIYEGTGLKARKTVALVSWNDANDRYKGKIEYVEDRDAIERYGYRELEVRAMGCTSQGQAQRVGRWALITNLNETETVTFKVAAEGFFLVPGEIIEIADPYKTAGIYAGMLVSASVNSAVLDREVSLEEGKSYEIIIRTADGEEIVASITNDAGATSAISFSPSFPQEPGIPAAWIIREGGVVPRKYRVIALNEDDGIVTVLASFYYEEKFSIVDDSTMLSTELTSIAGSTVVPVVSAGSIVLRST